MKNKEECMIHMLVLMILIIQKNKRLKKKDQILMRNQLKRKGLF